MCSENVFRKRLGRLMAARTIKCTGPESTTVSKFLTINCQGTKAAAVLLYRCLLHTNLHDFGVGELWLRFIKTAFICYPKPMQHTISAVLCQYMCKQNMMYVLPKQSRSEECGMLCMVQKGFPVGREPACLPLCLLSRSGAEPSSLNTFPCTNK